ESLVGGHHQHGQVDTARPGQHIFDKLFMPRHIHNTGLESVVKVQVGKTQLDGDPPLFLLHQPVGVDAGQSLDQKGRPMVHVARRANDDVFHASASDTAWTTASNSPSLRVRTSRIYCSRVIRPMTGTSRNRRRSSSCSRVSF